MTLTNIGKAISKMGFEPETVRLCSGHDALIVSMCKVERDTFGRPDRAVPVPRETAQRLYKYLKRYSVPHKYSADYKGVTICLEWQ